MFLLFVFGRFYVSLRLSTGFEGFGSPGGVLRKTTCDYEAPYRKQEKKSDDENILNNATDYVNTAADSADTASNYINRDANAKTNQYEGKHSQLNNQLVKVGREYVYILTLIHISEPTRP